MGTRLSAPVQTGPGGHPASCTMGTGSLPGVNCGRGVTLTSHPLPVPRSWKSRAIPLPTLWATTGPVTGTLYVYIYLLLLQIAILLSRQVTLLYSANGKTRPPLWSSGQSFWLQIQRSRVRFPALPDFLSSSGSGTGSTQPREVN